MTAILGSVLAVGSWLMTIAYFWRTYQWIKQREEIESLKLDVDAAQTAYNELGSERDELRAKCEQLSLDLAIVRREAEERANELDACKEQHAIEERLAAQWEKNYYGLRDDLRKLLAQWC
jgi:chromosome segregation ATPase